MIATYRDPRYGASIRFEQLREEHDQLLESLPEEVARIQARRVARSWAGAVAIVGFALLIPASIVHLTTVDGVFHDFSHPTLVLVGSLVLSAVAYGVARIVAAHSFAQAVWTSLHGSEGGDALVQVARLESDSVPAAARRLAGANEKRSVALPMAGIALLAPLTIHLAVWSLTHADQLDERWLGGFDWWIGVSLMLVGIAHVTLAILCYVFAKRVSQASVVSLSHSSPLSGWRALGWTVLASCLPGLIAFAIPVLAVFVTGLLFIPWMFRSMRVRVVEERRALGDE
jgi:hypothetical protein